MKTSNINVHVKKLNRQHQYYKSLKTTGKDGTKDHKSKPYPLELDRTNFNLDLHIICCT